jgi:ribosomal protein L2
VSPRGIPTHAYMTRRNKRTKTMIVRSRHKR